MISVIIPVYNSVEYLDECVASVVKQSVKNWECILVDDGSSDGSERKCDEWAVKDNRIIVIHQKNAGVSIARNVGIDCSKGDYLYFLDSDDWCEPSLFEHLADDDMIFGEYILGDMHIVSKQEYSDNYALSYLMTSSPASLILSILSGDIPEKNFFCALSERLFLSASSKGSASSRISFKAENIPCFAVTGLKDFVLRDTSNESNFE